MVEVCADDDIPIAKRRIGARNDGADVVRGHASRSETLKVARGALHSALAVHWECAAQAKALVAPSDERRGAVAARRARRAAGELTTGEVRDVPTDAWRERRRRERPARGGGYAEERENTVDPHD